MMFQQFLTPKYASFGFRLLAYIIDSILLAVVFFPLSLLVGAVAAMEGSAEAEQLSVLASAVIQLASTIAGWLYFAIMESSAWQATLGKRIFSIKVTDMSGNRIGFGKATGRYFGKILSGLICSIGFLMAAFTEKKQGLHDIIASTLVVEGKGGDTGITLDHTPPPPTDYEYRG